jgi:hypothetical protein
MPLTTRSARVLLTVVVPIAGIAGAAGVAAAHDSGRSGTSGRTHVEDDTTSSTVSTSSTTPRTTTPSTPTSPPTTSVRPGEDLRGNCDEAEHADEPRCAGVTPPTTPTTATTAATATPPTTIDDHGQAVEPGDDRGRGQDDPAVDPADDRVDSSNRGPSATSGRGGSDDTQADDHGGRGSSHDG